MDNYVVRKTVCDKLIVKFNAIDAKVPGTSRLITKTPYDSDQRNLQKEIDYVDTNIPNISSGLAKKTITLKVQRLKIRFVNTAMLNTKTSDGDKKNV